MSSPSNLPPLLQQTTIGRNRHEQIVRGHTLPNLKRSQTIGSADVAVSQCKASRMICAEREESRYALELSGDTWRMLSRGQSALRSPAGKSHEAPRGVSRRS